jgi:hypothetical protein
VLSLPDLLGMLCVKDGIHRYPSFPVTEPEASQTRHPRPVMTN